MYARVTPFKMKAEAVEAAKSKLEEMKSRILDLPGMQHFTCAMNDDGSGYIIALVSDKATSEANTDKVKALWGELADHLEEMPRPQGYDVTADWSV